VWQKGISLIPGVGPDLEEEAYIGLGRLRAGKGGCTLEAVRWEGKALYVSTRASVREEQYRSHSRSREVGGLASERWSIQVRALVPERRIGKASTKGGSWKASPVALWPRVCRKHESVAVVVSMALETNDGLYNSQACGSGSSPSEQRSIEAQHRVLYGALSRLLEEVEAVQKLLLSPGAR
jgi:hypothetical protein